MRVAIGYLVAALVVASRTVRSAAQSSDDKAAPAMAAAAVTVAAAAAAEKVDDGANKTSVAVEKIAAYSAPAPTFVSRKSSRILDTDTRYDRTRSIDFVGSWPHIRVTLSLGYLLVVYASFFIRSLRESL